MKEVIVTGGRNYNDWDKVHKALQLIGAEFIIQGGAAGADRLGRAYARLYKISCETINANWNNHGKAAGPIRNREMLKKYPNAIVVAFPGGAGTANCIKTALSLKMLVLEVK